MIKVMRFVSLALIIIVLAVVVLKMTGHGDAVDEVSTRVVHKLGLELDPNQSKQDFAKEVLGWDLKDLKNKPVATVKAGKARLLTVIDELEELHRKNRTTTSEAEIKRREAEEERQGLLDSIHEAKAHLQNPACSYPVRIRSITYANREQLETATADAIRRYQTLKRASGLITNNPEYGNSLSALIAKRLDTAYQMLEVLDARLMLAEMEETQMAFSEKEKELLKLEAKVDLVLEDGEKTVRKMPAGATSERERNARTIDSFTE